MKDRDAAKLITQTKVQVYYKQGEKNTHKITRNRFVLFICHILGNPDAMHNLGYMYENGFVHGSPKNNTASYLYFIDAAMKGQPDSALSLSAGQIYGDGIMLQNATSAAAWARNNAERLSAVGRLLQQGLKSFLKVIPIREFKNSNNFISPVE